MTPTALYSCSQPALYKVSKQVIQSLAANLEAFSAFKAKYSDAYVNLLSETVARAENLPDYKLRKAQSEVNYISLCNALSDGTLQWQKLKRYIKTAYPAAEHKQRLEEAGYPYYKKTIARNWEAANALFISTKNFLSKNTPVLSAHLNMPENFPELFFQSYLHFSKCLLTFQQSEKEIKTGTLLKLNSCNGLFTTITEICQDGQQIFKAEKSIREQFVFNTILHRVETPKRRELHQSDSAIAPESANMEL